ncbi:MAG: cation-transporting P-type ATPase [candidate division SR1 bacterium]|nr:cation-transporting P-type ATPase [candidate division SR1 bacterium]
MEIHKEPYYQLDIESSLYHLKTNKEGLSDQEVLLRREVYGQNIFSNLHHESSFHKFMKQFKDALIILLIIAAIISVYLQDYRGASILALLLLINVCIGYFQEAKAEKIIQSLKKMLHPVAKVKRDGKLVEIKASELVPGDIVFVDEGDNIPADLRIIEEMNLQTNDFSLTGESSPVNKYVHEIKGEANVGQRNNVMYMGTTVATGSGYGVVFATGMNTELGRIATLSHETVAESTTLQNEMQNISKKVIIGTLIVCVILVVIVLFLHFSIKDAFLFAVGIAAAMIPEGLPAEVSIALSLASGRLAKKDALVKQLSSVETLGCVNIICTDKTGTLTKNEMTVEKVFLGGKIFEITGSGYEANGIVTNEQGNAFDEKTIHTWEHFFLSCFLNAHAKVNPPDTEHPLRYAIGDPTEAALIVLAEKAGYNVNHLEQYPEVYEFGFDSVRKMMSSIRTVDGKNYAYIKGSCKDVVDHCTLYYDGVTIREMTADDRVSIMKTADDLASQAMRNLALAYKPIKDEETTFTMEGVENELIFLGIASIMDPPRDEVPMAMQAASDAHIKVVMITGDSALTAMAIAKKIGLEKNNEAPFVVTGDEIKEQSDIQLLKDLENKRVMFCRTSPEDKLRIVSLLKRHNNIVAVTGDGINDAPALKMANIGVAMGKIGTDVAKEASEIVLLDDSFATLVNAIREGRIIFQNIKKSAILAVASNGGELFVVLLSLLAGGIWDIPLAITATQILMIDLMAELIPITALTRDPPETGLMEAKPRDVKLHIFDRAVIIDWIRYGLLMGGIGFACYILYFLFHGLSLHGIDITKGSYATATAVTYTSVVFCQYANIFSLRTGPAESIFTSYFRSNKKLLWAFLFSFMGLLILIYTPGIHDYFSFGSMSFGDWMFPVAAGIVYLFAREMKKLWNRKRAQQENTPVEIGAGMINE